MHATVILLFASTLAAAAQTAASLAPLDSPRAMAERSNLTDEERGNLMLARKLYRDAIDFYKPTAEKNALMANKTGIAYHLMGDMRNAKKYYEKATKLDPHYAEAFNNLGTVYYAEKSYGNAIKRYNKSLEIKPDEASVWTNLGMAFLHQKKFDKAIAAYRRALEIDPKVFDKRGNNGELIQERSVEEQATFYFTLARAYAKAGDVEQTLRCMRFALEFGFKQRKRFLEDPEFAAFQDNADFKALLAMEQKVL
jgi:tetratricopeptide (TPR) repeat protein